MQWEKEWTSLRCTVFNIRYNFRYDNTGTAQYQNILTILTFKLQIKSLLKRKKGLKFKLSYKTYLTFLKNPMIKFSSKWKQSFLLMRLAFQILCIHITFTAWIRSMVHHSNEILYLFVELVKLVFKAHLTHLHLVSFPLNTFRDY